MLTTEELIQLAKRRMMPNYAPAPFLPSHGDGAYLWDTEGKRYLDFTTGIAVNTLGHAHPRVVEAVKKQVERFSHTSNMFHHEGYILLCDRICTLSGSDRVFLCNSGAEAIEAALKLVRLSVHARSEQRHHIVATYGGFHGRTYGALSLTANPTYREGFEPLMPSVTHVPFNDIDAMTQSVTEKTAAIFVEPIQGNTGVQIPEPGYLQALRSLCDKVGALLVVDEIQTGIGRTGAWFAYQHENIRPDIVTSAKALGGGLPLGAVVATEEIGSLLTLGLHGSTYGGNPIACASGLATLLVIEEENLLSHTENHGELFQGMLKQALSQHNQVVGIRGKGLMIGVELQSNAKAIVAACRDNGLLVTTAGPNVLRILPPLNVDREQLQMATDILAHSLHPRTHDV